MAILREDQVAGIFKNGSVKTRAALIYGSDVSAVSAVSRELLTGFRKAGVGDVGILRVHGPDVAKDGSQLIANYLAMSLLGERQAIVVDDCGDTLAKTVSAVLAGPQSGNFIVLLADSLPKHSKLRQLFELSDIATSTAVYEESGASLKTRLRSLLAAGGFVWGENAEELFLARVGTDRATVQREMEKLLLYCHGQTKIGVRDVEASCGDTASFDPDDLIDKALGGDFLATDRVLTSLEQSQQSAILQHFLFHLQRLQAIRLDMSGGANLESAVGRARPPIFFKRKPAILSQLRQFDMSALEELVLVVEAAVADGRSRAGLAHAIVSRTLFWIAGFSKKTAQKT